LSNDARERDNTTNLYLQNSCFPQIDKLPKGKYGGRMGGIGKRGQRMVYLCIVWFIIGVMVGWGIEVWICEKMVRMGRMVFKSGEKWIGTKEGIEEVWKAYNAECMRRG
jgi:hypothetical protein